jgi:hypothetical protein
MGQFIQVHNLEIIPEKRENRPCAILKRRATHARLEKPAWQARLDPAAGAEVKLVLGGSLL